jgi:hypothetical protein
VVQRLLGGGEKILTHFEFLVEDQSCGKAMDILAPKMIGAAATYKVISYKGTARIPKNLKPKTDPAKRMLLDQLPKLLRGYGKAQPDSCIVVICDLDARDKAHFLAELESALDSCSPRPRAFFCIAVEELEAWYLGDLAAIRSAYPSAKNDVLSRYVQDSICGTWELLADAVYRGGRVALAKKDWQAVGIEKSNWATSIAPYMDIEANRSPSFRHLCRNIESAAESAASC